MKHLKLFENWKLNEEFNIDGFKENMSSYVKNVAEYIDLDKTHKLYFVNIPYDALKNGIDSAEKVIKIAEKYPKCKTAVLNADVKEIRIVFTNESLKEAEETPIDLKAKFPELVAALEKAKIPCKVKLFDKEIVVECGWDYPDKIFDKVDKAATAVGLNTSTNVNVCADQAGGTVIDSKRIAGGPKRY